MFFLLLSPDGVARACLLALVLPVGSVSLLTSADHEEHLRRAPGAGRRGPLLGPGPSQAQARLQPGDLYPPPSGGRNTWVGWGVGSGRGGGGLSPTSESS